MISLWQILQNLKCLLPILLRRLNELEAAESTKSVLTPSFNPGGDTKSETLHASKSGPLHVRRETRDDPEFDEKLHKVEKPVTYYM